MNSRSMQRQYKTFHLRVTTQHILVWVSAEYTWGTPCFSIITLWKHFKQRAVFLSHKRLSRIVVCPASVCSRYCRYPPISGHVRVLGLQVMSCCTSCTCCMWFSSFYCALF
jgi:hypothetical protein